MPPRYAYWTILIDGKATAFRARERDELLPTFNQLARKNADIAMRYFARGRLWDTPEQAQWARNVQRTQTDGDKRGRDWRPGGQHKDPRARFTKPHDSGPRADRAGAKPQTRPATESRFQKPADRKQSLELRPAPSAAHVRHSEKRPPKPWDRTASPSAHAKNPQAAESQNRFRKPERPRSVQPRRKPR